MERDRSTIARKWLEFETTEHNNITKKFETKTQLEWLKLANKNQSTRFN